MRDRDGFECFGAGCLVSSIIWTILVLAVLFCTGCSQPLVPDLVVPGKVDYTPELAWELGKNEHTIIVVPEPVVPIKGTCEACKGTGKIDGDHDGIPDYSCGVCGGDGIIGEEPKMQEPITKEDTMTVCKDGVCYKVKKTTRPRLFRRRN